MLQNVTCQLGLPIDDEAVNGHFTYFKRFIPGGKSTFVWFEELFDELPPTRCIDKYTISYTLHLVATLCGQARRIGQI
ncbi:hypothetical protein AHAS_Ahas06G0033000 [Arachis hypogaea]